MLTSKFHVRRIALHASIIQNRMSSYGIETSSGIYVLQKKTSVSNGDQKNEIPEFLKNRRIEITSPNTVKDVYNKLLDVHNLKHSKRENNSNVYYGYSWKQDVFSRTLVSVFHDHQPQESLQPGFERITFNYNNGLYQLGSNDEGNSGEYELLLTNNVHPRFESKEFRPVYYSYEEAVHALRKMSHLEGAQDLLNMFPNFDFKVANMRDVVTEKPFIVVEGLDGTGKSTIAKNLAKHFNAVAMRTPPDSIGHIRRKFDNIPELCRRSFYALSNYLAANDAMDVTKNKAVVMDRYWHSTTAYAVAKDAVCGVTEHLPGEHHPLYAWPDDLLRPTAVVFLTTPEKERDFRVNERAELTAEEKELGESERFRARVMTTYRRIGHPKWVEVDTRGTKEQSLEIAVEKLRQVGIE